MADKHRPARKWTQLVLVVAVAVYGIVGFPSPQDPAPSPAAAHPIPGFPHSHGGTPTCNPFAYPGCPPLSDGTNPPPQQPDDPSEPNPGQRPDNSDEEEDECGVNSNPDGHGGCTAPLYGRPERCTGATTYDSVSRLCISTNPDVDLDYGDRTVCPDPKQFWSEGRCQVKDRDDDPDRSRHCPAGQVFYSTIGCAYPCSAGQILVDGVCQTVSRPQQQRPQQPGDPPPPQCPVGYSGTPPNCVEGTPEIYVIDQSVGESDGTVDVTLALSHRATTVSTVEVATSDGTATDGSDYTAVTRTVTIPANTQTARVPVPILNDTDHEAEETFTVSISNAAGGAELGTSTSGTMAIVDDDPFTGTLSGLTAVCVDGEITVSWQRPGQVPGLTSYRYLIADNVYLFSNGAFYASGSISDPDETSVTVAVTDASLDYYASIRTNLYNAWREIGPFTCTESLPVVSFDDTALTVEEGSSVQINASLDRAPTATASAGFAVSGPVFSIGACSQQPNAKFSLDPTRFTFTSDTAAHVTLTACNDADRNDETVTLTLASNSISGLEVGSPSTVTIYIADTTDPPEVSISGPTGPVAEEAAGDVANDLTFTVTLDGASTQNVFVTATTSSGTATGGTCGTPGVDFASKTETPTFTPGDIEETFTVQTCPDAVTGEGTEDFTVTLSVPANAELGTATATGEIDDTDVVAVSISGPSGPVAEEDANGLSNSVVFTVVLDIAAAEEVTVMVHTTAGTASDAACASGGDFLHRSMTVRFNPGATSKSFNVRTCTDGVPEHDEDFTATISSPTNAVLGTATTATATIQDNDKPTVSISAPPAAVIEDTNGVPNTLTFAVTLDVAGVQAVTVVVSTSSGTATGGSCGSGGIDFVSRSATITFTAGDTSKDFTVDTCADTIANEGVEDFTVSLSNPTNAALGTDMATGRVADNDSPPIYR